MPPEVVVALVVGGCVALMAIVGVVALRQMLVRVGANEALVVLGTKEPQVRFHDTIVFPVIQRAERVKLHPTNVTIERRGKDGLICHDCIRADIVATFVVAVPRNADDILKVVGTLRAERASDERTLQDLFEAKFSEGLKVVARRLEFAELSRKREEFRDAVLSVVGADLHGFSLADLIIDGLEQTPLGALDDQNILDAQGMAKISRETEDARRIRETERMETERRLAILEAEARQTLIELERHEADALGRLRADTGRSVTHEALQRRLEDKLREVLIARGL